MRIKNLPSIESMDGSQDALVIEQTDGSEDKSRKVSPAQIKQYVLGNSIDDIYSVMGQNGAKNLNSYPYNETSHTDNGIAWTDNGDGTVVANNTATGNSGFVCHSRVLSSVNKLIVPNGTYILSGCPSGGSSTTFNIGATITKNGSAMALGTDNGSGATITINGDDNYTDKAIVQIICNIKSGVAASNLTFKPMLRLASDTDDTYVPYAKTNKQLTDELDTAGEQIAKRTEYFVSSTNGTTQTINIGVAPTENRTFLFACGFHTNYVLELIAMSGAGNITHIPIANSSINSISNISYNANTGDMTITVLNNPFTNGRMTRLS